jgi:predicted site-specific integrase-resolvase
MRNAAHEGDDTELVSTAEAATLLGKSTATINRWADSGALPVAFKAPGVRGARFFARADVENLSRALALATTP